MSRDRVFLDPDFDEVGWSATRTESCPVEFVRASTVPKWMVVKEDGLPPVSGTYVVILQRDAYAIMDFALGLDTWHGVYCWLSHQAVHR